MLYAIGSFAMARFRRNASGLLLFACLLSVAAGAFGQYSYYYPKDFTDGIDDSTHWNVNGVTSQNVWGIRADYGFSTANMSMISSDAVPGGSNNYEAKVTFVHPKVAVYLRASSTANYFANTGTFYALTYQAGRPVWVPRVPLAAVATA